MLSASVGVKFSSAGLPGERTAERRRVSGPQLTDPCTTMLSLRTEARRRKIYENINRKKIPSRLQGLLHEEKNLNFKLMI